MLNKPKFMSPSLNSYGKNVIDLTSGTLPFSCVVDGNEAVIGWQIVVSKLEDNATVFDSGKQELIEPFYPINHRNQNVVFSVDLKKCGVDFGDEFSNSDTAYYWNITLWGSSETTTQSSGEVFYANSAPDVEVYYSYDNNSKERLEDGVSLAKRKVFLKGEYSQEQGVPLKRYGWKLTDTTNNVVIIDTISQNQIYGVGDDMVCECNGLVNKTSYKVELYVETQNGYFDVVQTRSFDVDYVVKSIDADFEVEALNETSGIMLNFGNLRTTEGVVAGSDVDYKENFPIEGSVSVEIPKDSKIVFDSTSNGKNLEISEESYVTLSFQFDKTKDVVLFEMSGKDKHSNTISRELKYTASNRALKYTVKSGDIVASFSETLSDRISEVCWYIVTMYPLSTENGYNTRFKLVESIAEGGLYPSDSLFPSENTYPRFGEWDKLRKG